MTFSKNSTRRLVPGLALAAAMVVGGCKMGGSDNSTTPMKADVTAPSASLRVTLDDLLREHVVLAAAATDAALGGRSDEFQAAANALDANSQDLAGAIGSVYGTDAGNAFLPLWRKHIGFFVDYTQATAAKDSDKQTKAVNDLVGYTQDFGAFIEQATGGRLKKDAVADLVKTHVVGLKTVVDDQAAKNYADAYTQERACEKQMDTIGDALAGAIVDQFPDKFAK